MVEKTKVAKDATKVAKAVKTDANKVKVEVEPIKVTTIKVSIIGTSPLLMEKMSEEIKEELQGIFEGKGREKKKLRNFEAETRHKIHLTDDGKPGFPASAFKKAIVEGAVYMDGMDKKLARSIVVQGNIIPITFKKQVINKVMGRDSGIRRSPRPIWRPEFQGWGCTLSLMFNSAQISEGQVINLIKLAGFHIGVGGWRPQCSGNMGTFTIAQ